MMASDQRVTLRRTPGLRYLGALLFVLFGFAAEAASGQTGNAVPLPAKEAFQPPLDDALPTYQPCLPQPLQGTFDGSVPAILPDLTNRWIAAFQERHPGVHLRTPPPYLAPQGRLNPSLQRFLDAQSDFAFVSRDLSPADTSAYLRSHGMDAVPIPVVGGSWRHFGFIDAVGVIVNASNPVQALTLAQLDAVFSQRRLRGHDAVHTWGDLGVAGWSDKPVHVVGAAAWLGKEPSARAIFMQDAVLSVGPLNGQWRDDLRADGKETDVPNQVAADPYAVGFTGLGHLAAGVKAIAIAEGGEAIAPSDENVSLGRYPLARVGTILLSRKPGQPIAPALREFVRFMLSREGQQIVLDQGIMLPLRARQVDMTRRQLSASGDARGCE
ncbi:PstS family phosphate ABC transporter substrate-binding protein [Ralstonia holmesii]|uniref:PstS family phosphate ABC transporter substrate-binding protein n=1 Tax=Ralstonia holmesii TaxID=3058602 RepID=UPI003F163F15